MSEDAQDLIKRLICVPSERFGKNGLDEFKAHVWFSGIDWDNIRDSMLFKSGLFNVSFCLYNISNRKKLFIF